MKKFDDIPFIKNALTYIFAGIVLLVVYFVIQNLDIVLAQFSKFFDILTPLIYGVVIAFLLSPLVAWFEKKALNILKTKPGIKHIIAVVLTLIVTIEVLILFFSFIIPQLIASLSMISERMPYYVQELRKWLIPLLDQYNIQNSWLDAIMNSSEDLLGKLTELLQTYLPDILDYSLQFTKTVFNLILSLTLAVYLLLDEKAFVLQSKKFIYAMGGQKIGDEVVSFIDLTSFMLHKFILGKALNSLILGVLCYLAMLVIGLEYPVLMSSLIGVTNMIPFFGPFIGGAFGAMILVLENPIHAVWFIILASVLQQIEGSILSPWIIGDSMGLPGLWVMVAIIVGGGYFGIVGMFLGVPFFAVLYLLSKRYIDKKIEKDQLDIK